MLTSLVTDSVRKQKNPKCFMVHFCRHLIHLNNDNVGSFSVSWAFGYCTQCILRWHFGNFISLFGTSNFKKATGKRKIFYEFRLRWLTRVDLDMFWFSAGQKTRYFSISSIFWVAEMFTVIVKEGRQFSTQSSDTNLVKLWERFPVSETENICSERIFLCFSPFLWARSIVSQGPNPTCKEQMGLVTCNGEGAGLQ